MNNKTGIINDSRMLLHKAKRKHPECPQRVKEIMKVMKESGYLDHPKIQFIDKYDRKASNEEIGYVYPQKYIKYIQQLWPKASHRTDLTVLDTYFCQHSEEAARISAGGVLLGIDQVMKKNWRNGYSIIRPPGHHSGYRNTINGFCIFNNVAIGAKYLKKKYGVKKIFIIDWDIHHGDGTQSIFQEDPDVLFFSIHRFDHGTYYPSGDGHSMFNCGKGVGEGSKLNIPLNYIDQNYKTYKCQAPGDNQYIYIYHRIIEPIVNQFNPQFILISSGYDASRYDPLGGFSVTPNGYYYMAKRLVDLGKPILAVLEGGYNIKELSLASLAVVKALIQQQALPEPINNITYENIHQLCYLPKVYHSNIDKIIDHHSRFWKVLENENLKNYTNLVKKNQKKIFGLVKKKQQGDSSSSSQSENQKEQVTFSKSQQQKQIQPPLKQQICQTTVKSPKQVEPLTKTKSQESEWTKLVNNETEDSQSTSQFYFAAGHMQRFKNFSIDKEYILKMAYPQQILFYQSNYPEKQFAPKYLGQEGDYIAIQNLLYLQQDHFVVDFKLSRPSKNPSFSIQKSQKLAKKDQLTTSQKYAFRVSGFTTPTYKETGVVVADETFVKKILAKVVTSENKEMYCEFLRKMVQTLKSVNRKYFNTSILLIKGKNKSRIGWIDFHYIYLDCPTYDIDLVEGIQNLSKFIQQVDTSKS